MTGVEVTISPGTMYGTLSKMEKDGLIRFIREEEGTPQVLPDGPEERTVFGGLRKIL